MPAPDPRRRSAALHPMALFWAAIKTLAWPFVQLKRSIKTQRRKSRPGNLRPPPNPIDQAATDKTLSKPGPHIILTGPGLGEYVMYKRVATALLQQFPEAKLSYAMRDGDAVVVVRSIEPETNVSYCPPDGYRAALRWLESQRPDLLVFIENYAYPHLIATAKGFGAKLVLVNGRRRWRTSFRNPLISSPHRWMLRQFTALGMQNEPNADVVRKLAPNQDIRSTGDIKTDVRVAPLPADREADLTQWLVSDSPLLAAGSTDNLEEEKMVLEAFQQARKRTPCKLLIAPRRSSGTASLLQLLEQKQIPYKTREQTSAEAEVFVLDTQGELATAYRHCLAVYVGGSFSAKGGGHNVMEPLAWGLPVAFGPHPGNFEAIQNLVEKAQIGIRIANAHDLAGFYENYLQSPVAQQQARGIATKLVEENKGAVEKTVRMLLDLSG